MGSKLSDVNPYLRDPVKSKRALMRSVVSSSAIEGIRVSFKTLMNGTRKRAPKKARSKS
jgi:Fic family protein